MTPHALATLAVLLAVSVLCGHCLPAEEALAASDCLPEMPPNANSSGALVTLQMHQWVWIQNITEPEWGPRVDSGAMVYEFLRPGVVRHLRLPLLGLRNAFPTKYVNLSYVTDGDTLCAAAFTVYRNQSGDTIDTTECSRICHANFTSLGTRANLPLLVLNDWNKLSRSSEYLAFDAVDPDTRASYTCMGYFNYNYIRLLPTLMRLEKRCPEGDECLFNYDNILGLVNGGCKSDFRELSFCVSDLELCSYNINGDCPVCCRGDLCNRPVAQKVYNKWLNDGGGLGSSHAASSVWLLAVTAVLSLLLLRSQH